MEQDLTPNHEKTNMDHETLTMQHEKLTTKHEKLTKLAEEICAQFPHGIDFNIYADELTLNLTAENILAVCQQLILPPYSFEMLIDLCGVDYLYYGMDDRSLIAKKNELDDSSEIDGGKVIDGRKVINDCKLIDESKTSQTMQQKLQREKIKGRFAVVYHLLSIKNNQRIRLHCWLQDVTPRVVTLTSIWPNADWYEREAFDLFGILFDGHPDLRRLLTDYGFVGHPFRKDFPLSGEVEMRYDAVEQRVVYEPVSIEPRILVPKVIRPNNRLNNGLNDIPNNVPNNGLNNAPNNRPNNVPANGHKG